jgi:purine-binding chemotaxis protein CheW
MGASAPTNDTRQYVTYMTNGQEFASDIMDIREIRGWTDTEAMPNTPDYVRGIINLRGTVLPVIDLMAKLGLGKATVSPTNVIIVIDGGSRLTGLLVDSVSDIITLSAVDIHPAPDVSVGGSDTTIDGIAICNDRMVTILNADCLTANPEDTVAGGT